MFLFEQCAVPWACSPEFMPFGSGGSASVSDTVVASARCLYYTTAATKVLTQTGRNSRGETIGTNLRDATFRMDS